MDIGFYNESSIKGNITYVNRTGVNWGVKLLNFTYGNYIANKTYTAVIDTSSAFTVLPELIYN